MLPWVRAITEVPLYVYGGPSRPALQFAKKRKRRMFPSGAPWLLPSPR
jgi:hypothetical protein